MAKALVWILTSVGLIPSIFVAIGGIIVLYNARRMNLFASHGKLWGMDTGVFISEGVTEGTIRQNQPKI